MPALLVPILAARISTGNTLVPTDSAVRAREVELTGGSGACMTRGSAWPQTSSTAEDMVEDEGEAGIRVATDVVHSQHAPVEQIRWR